MKRTDILRYMPDFPIAPLPWTPVPDQVVVFNGDRIPLYCKIFPAVALWRWRRRRWEKVRGLPLYFPPDFLRIRRLERSGKEIWTIEAREFPLLHGADRLTEALEALIRACKRPPGGGPLVKLESGRPPREVEGIEPFTETSLWDHGLFLQRLREPPDRWLLSLELARPVEGLYVSRWERYLAPWGVALEALLSAVKEESPA